MLLTQLGFNLICGISVLTGGPGGSVLQLSDYLICFDRLLFPKSHFYSTEEPIRFDNLLGGQNRSVN